MKSPYFIIRSVIAFLLSGIALLTLNMNTVIGETEGEFVTVNQ